MPHNARSLHFAARVPIIARYFGQLLIVIAAFSLVPFAVSLGAGANHVAARYAIVIIVLGAAGWLASRLRSTQKLQRNEALVVSGLAFCVPPFFLAVPLMGYGISYEDAVFETISGITTTGLSTLGTVEDKPYPFLFARAWLQWVGGFGVIVLSLALFITPSAAAKQLGFSKREMDDIAGGTRSHARKGLIIYGTLTAIGIATLLALGSTPLDAVSHTFAAVSTGGFSNYDDSLAAVSSGERAVLTALCLTGSLSFYFFYRFRYGKWRQAILDVQLATILVVALTSALLLLVFSSQGAAANWQTRVTNALLMAFSAQTTAGFSSQDVTEMDSASILVLIGSMFIGGGLGSTAGGIKAMRLIILGRLVQMFLRRQSRPANAVMPVRLSGQRLQPLEIEAAIAIVLGYAATILASWCVFLAYGHEPLPALFEVTSAVATAGLSSGVTQESLATPLKAVLCFDMLVGRVEVLALIVLLLPATWVGKRRGWR